MNQRTIPIGVLSVVQPITDVLSRELGLANHMNDFLNESFEE